jgi:hypothetical protein
MVGNRESIIIHVLVASLPTSRAREVSAIKSDAVVMLDGSDVNVGHAAARGTRSSQRSGSYYVRRYKSSSSSWAAAHLYMMLRIICAAWYICCCALPLLWSWRVLT